MFENTFKNLDDVLRKEAGCATELDYAEQTSWMLILEYLDEIVTPDIFAASTRLREINSFIRDDGTPLNYTPISIKDWCKNTFEIVNQVRINTDNSHHRYDVMLLINGIPTVQIELKTLGISPRIAMKQIVDYKKDPGNGYIARSIRVDSQLLVQMHRWKA